MKIRGICLVFIIFASTLTVESEYLTDANVGLSSKNVQAIIFSQDAFRIGMQKNIDLEIARRPEAVGSDVVASLHAGVADIDATNRSTMIINAS